MKQRGFINLILLIILALIILYYMHIPLSGILSSPLAGQFGEILKTLIVVLWQDFLLIVQFIQKVASGGTISLPQFNFGSITTKAIGTIASSSMSSSTVF